MTDPTEQPDEYGAYFTDDGQQVRPGRVVLTPDEEREYAAYGAYFGDTTTSTEETQR